MVKNERKGGKPRIAYSSHNKAEARFGLVRFVWLANACRWASNSLGRRSALPTACAVADGHLCQVVTFVDL